VVLRSVRHCTDKPHREIYFRAHSIKSLERNVLGFIGMAPVHETLIGMTSDFKPEAASKWLGKLEKLGSGAE
jgi:hypothetical protein